MSNVTLGILGVSPRVTLTVPNARPDGGDPIQALHSARRRFVSQGASLITLVPRRDGVGWTIMEKKENTDV